MHFSVCAETNNSPLADDRNALLIYGASLCTQLAALLNSLLAVWINIPQVSPLIISFDVYSMSWCYSRKGCLEIIIYLIEIFMAQPARQIRVSRNEPVHKRFIQWPTIANDMYSIRCRTIAP